MFSNYICDTRESEIHALCHFQEECKMAAVSMETQKEFSEHEFSES